MFAEIIIFLQSTMISLVFVGLEPLDYMYIVGKIVSIRAKSLTESLKSP